MDIDKLGVIKKPAYGYATAIEYIRELEEQRNEMLEALIELMVEDDNFDGAEKYLILIEKTTGKTWEEIKKVLED